MTTYCGTGSGNYPQPGDPDFNGVILSAAPAFGGIDVTWTYPDLNPHAVAYFILYRSTSSDPATMLRYRTVQGDFFYDRVDNGNTYYYWIQTYSVNETYGDVLGPASAQARPTIDQMLEMLSGQINDGTLATALKDDLARIDTVQQDLLTERSDRINEDDLLSSAFGNLQTNVDTVEVSLQDEIDARASADSAQVNSINQLSVRADDNLALIEEEKILRANEDEALATRIDTVAAASTNIFRQDVAPDPATETVNLHDLWIDSSDGNRMYQWDGMAWVDVQDTGIASAFAAIETEETARTTADTSLGQRIDTVAASVNDNSAAIQTEQTTRADADDALASQITTLETTTADNSAAISSEATTRADADQALSSRVDTLFATTSQTFRKDTAPDPALVTINTNDLWVNTAEGNRLYQWDGTVWVDVQDQGIAGAFSAIEDEQTARVSEDEALAQSITTLEASVGRKSRTYFQTTPPATPENAGDLWIDTDDNNKLYRWDGTAWAEGYDLRIGQALQDASDAQSTADGKIESFWQSTAPAGKAVGDLWFDTGNQNKPHRWNGTAWEDARDSKIGDALQAATTAQDTADGKVTTFYQNTAPAAEGIGDLWVDTDDKNHLYRWDGTNWVDVADKDKLKVFRQATAPTAENIGDLWFDSDDGDKGYRWDGTVWGVLNLYTGNQVSAAIQDNNTTRVGYCLINGSPDGSIDNRDDCVAATGTWLALTGLAEAVKGVQITDGDNETANVEQRMRTYKDELNVLNSEYTVKVQTDTNGNKIVGGFGIATDSGTGTVEAGFDVDRFWVGKLGNKRFPFIIDGTTNEVFMDEAVIQELTFSKLRSSTGSLIVDGDKLKAANIDAANLRLAYGNIDNVDITRAVIRDGAISDAKIANGNITNAKIADGAITSAKIGTAEIGTLKIGKDEVTVAAASSGTGETGGDTWGSNIASFTYNHGGSESLPVIFSAHVSGYAEYTDSSDLLTKPDRWRFRLVVGGSVKYVSPWVGTGNVSASCAVKVSLGSSNYSVYVDVEQATYSSVGYYSGMTATITAIGCKR